METKVYETFLHHQQALEMTVKGRKLNVKLEMTVKGRKLNVKFKKCQFDN
jgi:hypothetical protein